jgi:hypothetical protein
MGQFQYKSLILKVILVLNDSGQKLMLLDMKSKLKSTCLHVKEDFRKREDGFCLGLIIVYIMRKYSRAHFKFFNNLFSKTKSYFIFQYHFHIPYLKHERKKFLSEHLFLVRRFLLEKEEPVNQIEKFKKIFANVLFGLNSLTTI